MPICPDGINVFPYYYSGCKWSQNLSTWSVIMQNRCSNGNRGIMIQMVFNFIHLCIDREGEGEGW